MSVFQSEPMQFDAVIEMYNELMDTLAQSDAGGLAQLRMESLAAEEGGMLRMKR